MAFDPTQPQDTTKLRNLGNVIRPNWVAIETADSTFIPEALNLANRTPLVAPNDPTAIADTVILYSKEDGSGDPQVYAIDPSSVITQLTGGSLTAANPGKLVLANGLTILWGTLSATTTWTNVNLPLTGFANTGFSITGSASGTTKIVGFQNLTQTQVSIKCDSGTTTATFIAIGN